MTIGGRVEYCEAYVCSSNVVLRATFRCHVLACSSSATDWLRLSLMALVGQTSVEFGCLNPVVLGVSSNDTQDSSKHARVGERGES